MEISQEQVLQLYSSLRSNDQAAINEATEVIASIYSNPAHIPFLFSLFRQTDELFIKKEILIGIRQMLLCIDDLPSNGLSSLQNMFICLLEGSKEGDMEKHAIIIAKIVIDHVEDINQDVLDYIFSQQINDFYFFHILIPVLGKFSTISPEMHSLIQQKTENCLGSSDLESKIACIFFHISFFTLTKDLSIIEKYSQCFYDIVKESIEDSDYQRFVEILNIIDFCIENEIDFYSFFNIHLLLEEINNNFQSYTHLILLRYSINLVLENIDLNEEESIIVLSRVFSLSCQLYQNEIDIQTLEIDDYSSLISSISLESINMILQDMISNIESLSVAQFVAILSITLSSMGKFGEFEIGKEIIYYSLEQVQNPRILLLLSSTLSNNKVSTDERLENDICVLLETMLPQPDLFEIRYATLTALNQLIDPLRSNNNIKEIASSYLMNGYELEQMSSILILGSFIEEDQEIMETILSCLNSQSSLIRLTSFEFLSNTSKAYPGIFRPFIEHIIPFICSEDDEICSRPICKIIGNISTFPEYHEYVGTTIKFLCDQKCKESIKALALIATNLQQNELWDIIYQKMCMFIENQVLLPKISKYLSKCDNMTQLIHLITENLENFDDHYINIIMIFLNGLIEQDKIEAFDGKEDTISSIILKKIPTCSDNIPMCHFIKQILNDPKPHDELAQSVLEVCFNLLQNQKIRPFLSLIAGISLSYSQVLIRSDFFPSLLETLKYCIQSDEKNASSACYIINLLFQNQNADEFEFANEIYNFLKTLVFEVDEGVLRDNIVSAIVSIQKSCSIEEFNLFFETFSSYFVIKYDDYEILNIFEYLLSVMENDITDFEHLLPYIRMLGVKEVYSYEQDILEIMKKIYLFVMKNIDSNEDISRQIQMMDLDFKSVFISNINIISAKITN